MSATHKPMEWQDSFYDFMQESRTSEEVVYYIDSLLSASAVIWQARYDKQLAEQREEIVKQCDALASAESRIASQVSEIADLVRKNEASLKHDKCVSKEESLKLIHNLQDKLAQAEKHSQNQATTISKLLDSDKKLTEAEAEINRLRHALMLITGDIEQIPMAGDAITIAKQALALENGEWRRV